jgi:phosphatidate cytidylyltransferase
MLIRRAIVSLTLLPLGLLVIYLGGWPLWVVIGVFTAAAGWEYVQLMKAGGLRPAGVMIPGGALLLLAGRAYDGFASAPALVSLLILLAMAHHLFAFERGRQEAAADFGISLAGMLYIGWLGAYLYSVRMLPEGQWWLLIVLPSVWLADSGAYVVGTRLGRTLLSPRLSPHKTWEGYLGGIAFATLGSAGLAALYGLWAGPATAVTPLRAALLGLVIAAASLLGDLGESMIKRLSGAKDSGNFLPGHGGAFDRIDSWLWAGVVGYYLIVWGFVR